MLPRGGVRVTWIAIYDVTTLYVDQRKQRTRVASCKLDNANRAQENDQVGIIH